MHTTTLDEDAYAADSSGESDQEYRHPVYRPTHSDPPRVTSRPESTLSRDGSLSTEGATYIDPSAIVSIPETSHRMEELKHHNLPGYLVHPQMAATLTSSPLVTRTEFRTVEPGETLDSIHEEPHQLNVPLTNSGNEDAEIYDISNDAVGISQRPDDSFQNLDIEEEARANRVRHVACLHPPPRNTHENEENLVRDGILNELGSLEGDDLDEILKINLDRLADENENAVLELDGIVREQGMLIASNSGTEHVSESRVSRSPAKGSRNPPTRSLDDECNTVDNPSPQKGHHHHHHHLQQHHQDDGEWQKPTANSAPKPNRRRISQLYLTLIDSSQTDTKTSHDRKTDPDQVYHGVVYLFCLKTVKEEFTVNVEFVV